MRHRRGGLIGFHKERRSMFKDHPISVTVQYSRINTILINWRNRDLDSLNNPCLFFVVVPGLWSSITTTSKDPNCHGTCFNALASFLCDEVDPSPTACMKSDERCCVDAATKLRNTGAGNASGGSATTTTTPKPQVTRIVTASTTTFSTVPSTTTTTTPRSTTATTTKVKKNQ